MGPERLYTESVSELSTQLHISKINLEDAGSYTCRVGSFEAEVSITVKGEFSLDLCVVRHSQENTLSLFLKVAHYFINQKQENDVSLSIVGSSLL